MKNIVGIIFCLALFLQWSCSNTKKEDNGKLEFISIDRIKAKRLIDRFDEKKGYYYGEPVLVKNPPKDLGYAIENMMIDYVEKFGIDFNKKNIKEYRLSFYKYNSDTEVYLTQDYRNTWNGVTINLGDENESKLGKVILERCDSIGNKWSQYIYIFIHEDDNSGGYYLEYRTDSCVSVVNNQFQRIEPISYKPMD